MGVDITSDHQAGGRLCPVAPRPFAIQVFGVAIFRFGYVGQPEGMAPCIGSACMAWRSRVSAHARDIREAGQERIGTHSAGGYCGLAGRPE